MKTSSDYTGIGAGVDVRAREISCSQPIPPTHANIRAALSFISPSCDRDTWVRVLAAIKDALGEDGRDIADEWSQEGDSYDKAAFRDAWKSIKPGGKVTVATLWKMALDGGWKPDGKAHQEPEAQRLERERKQKARADKDAKDRQRKAEEAERKAAALWTVGTALRPDHPYHARKLSGTTPPDTLREIPEEQAAATLGYHPKSDGEPLAGRLIVAPVKVGDKFTTAEFIDEAGRKTAIAGGSKSGGYWAAQALPEGDGAGATIAIGEGVYTVLSVRHATDCHALAALSASNILKVAQAMREQLPAARLLILGDLGNGQDKAERAARETGATLAVPKFTPEQVEAFQHQHGKPPTDFNDLHQIAGPDEVGRQVAAALEAPTQDAAPKGQPGQLATDSGETDGFPPPEKRPCWRVYDDWCGPNGKHPPGVYYHGMTSGGDDKKAHPVNLRVCSPLHIEAVTCTDDGRNFGRFLRFRDTFGRWREWAMPMEMLAGSCEELRRELLSAGVKIEHKERGRLPDYLQWRTPKRRVLAATRTGWTRDGQAFVLPEEVIGSADVFYQAESMHQDGTAEKGGSFDAWKSEVAALCVGNPVLALSVCSALAGPLLDKINRDSGGIHWVGDSSTGKTTALNAGASVWGGDTFRRTWRATANGLEGAAAALNDTCLCLDEINEADPREVGAVVYALGNGTGKSRATRTGAARSAYRWRLTWLSTGEKTLETIMTEGGKKPNAGQLVRLLNVPANRKHGAFDTLHQFTTGRALADHLKTATRKHYGHAGPAFIEAMLRDGRDFGADLADVEALPGFQTENSQEARAASRFALYGMAGELAVEWGILPWPEGEALSAAVEGFRLWQEARGGGMTEDRQILRAVADFISRHGDARFSRKGDTQTMVRDRAGWWTDTDAGQVHLFTGEGLREATKGYDFGRALAALDAAGWIHGRDSGKQSKATDIGNRQKQRLYWVLPGDLDE